ncbi:MAG: hypothetical protein WC955_07375 [Elusimicrobiota bacterium]
MEIIDINTIFGVSPRKEQDVSFPQLQKVLDKHNITRACALSWKGVYYDYELGNEETLSTTKLDPRIIPIATIDPRRFYGDTHGKLADSIVSSGFKALRLFPDIQGWPLTYAPFYQIVNTIIMNTRLPLILPTPRLGFITDCVEILEQNITPCVPLVFTGINYAFLSEALVVMKTHKNVNIDTSLFDTPDGYELINKEGCVSQIMLGTGSPANYFLPAYESVMRSTLDDKEKSLIFAGNAVRILDI